MGLFQSFDISASGMTASASASTPSRRILPMSIQRVRRTVNRTAARIVTFAEKDPDSVQQILSVIQSAGCRQRREGYLRQGRYRDRFYNGV